MTSLRDPKDCIKQAKNDKRKECHSERSEESLLWLTFRYDAILHFVQNDRGEGDEGQKDGLSLVDPKDCVEQAKNDKPGEHPPTPFKGGTFGYNSPPIPLLWRGQGVVGRGM